MSDKEAFEELRRYAGIQFDKDIVLAFINVIRDKEDGE